MFGGGMRQTGILAAAGIYALDHHRERLRKDHDHAKRIASTLMSCAYVSEILPVETNIVIFKLHETFAADIFIKHLASHDILAFTIGENWIRFVTHLDVTEVMTEHVCKILPKLNVHS